MIGETIKGIYKIYEVVSEGPLINVFMGRNSQTNEIVAIKTISKRIFDEILGISRAEWNKRFRQEMDGLGRVTSPQIARTYDYGDHDDSIFIVGEYVAGSSLKDIVGQRAPLPVEEAVEIARQVAVGLQAAAVEKLAHGDVRPANVMLSASGMAKILNFGLSKSFIIEGLMPRAIVEMPHYVAPEQGEGEFPDGRSDIYALGVMLYEMLTSELPFTSEDPTRLILKHINEPIPSVRALQPDVPAAVEAIVNRCMAKRPADRFQTADELVGAFATGRAAPVLVPPKAEAPEEVVAEAVLPTPEVGAPPPTPASAPPPPVQPPPPRPEPQPAPAAEAALPRIPTEKRKGPSLILIGAGAVSAVIIIALVVSSLLGGGEQKAGPSGVVEPAATITVTPAAGSPSAADATMTALAAASAATTVAPATPTATLTPAPSPTPTPFQIFLPFLEKGE